MTPWAAWIAVPIFFGMMIFQILLALGLPWGKIAWGGNHRVLPFTLRIGSLISAGIFLLALMVTLQRAKIVLVFNWPILEDILIWFFVGLLTLSTLGNLTSESRLEKKIMTPIALVLMLLCLLIALEI